MDALAAATPVMFRRGITRSLEVTAGADAALGTVLQRVPWDDVLALAVDGSGAARGTMRSLFAGSLALGGGGVIWRRREGPHDMDTYNNSTFNVTQYGRYLIVICIYIAWSVLYLCSRGAPRGGGRPLAQELYTCTCIYIYI